MSGNVLIEELTDPEQFPECGKNQTGQDTTGWIITKYWILLVRDSLAILCASSVKSGIPYRFEYRLFLS